MCRNIFHIIEMKYFLFFYISDSNYLLKTGHSKEKTCTKNVWIIMIYFIYESLTEHYRMKIMVLGENIRDM